MHPKLLDSTITQCRDYTAGDCHGEAPPVGRLVAAVVQLAGGVTLSADDAAFLAARLRRLCAHMNYTLPKFADDDSALINIAGTVIGALLMNLTAPAGVPGGVSPDVPNDPECTCGSDSPRAYTHKGTCPHSIPWNERVQKRLAAAGVLGTFNDQQKGGA
jgi:hypothetical protein